MVQQLSDVNSSVIMLWLYNLLLETLVRLMEHRELLDTKQLLRFVLTGL